MLAFSPRRSDGRPETHARSHGVHTPLHRRYRLRLTRAPLVHGQRSHEGTDFTGDLEHLESFSVNDIERSVRLGRNPVDQMGEGTRGAQPRDVPICTAAKNCAIALRASSPVSRAMGIANEAICPSEAVPPGDDILNPAIRGSSPDAVPIALAAKILAVLAIEGTRAVQREFVRMDVANHDNLPTVGCDAPDVHQI